MNFSDAVDFLYGQLPMYQRVGAPALKKDLSNTIFLLEKFGNPHFAFKSIHIAGTNGKGSSAHIIASVLQAAGYKTGLYTSPHLKSFTERIKVNGKEIDEESVVDFVEQVRPMLNSVSPSFFEITVAMAFDYFKKQDVDIAVVEVGLGGRLDSTNVLDPEVSLITNISLDHTELLGKHIKQIAFEKAGIIKRNKPIVIGKYQPEVSDVFEEKAIEQNSKLIYATDLIKVNEKEGTVQIEREGNPWINVKLKTSANYFLENLPGSIAALLVLEEEAFDLADSDFITGLESLPGSTGLWGRWQTIHTNPLAICDVGHNLDGIDKVLREIKKLKYDRLRIVWGSLKDKDINPILEMLPKDAKYYFCEPAIPRALKVEDLAELASEKGLQGKVIRDVNEAYTTALSESNKNDFIFVGGSTFVVAEIDDLEIGKK